MGLRLGAAPAAAGGVLGSARSMDRMLYGGPFLVLGAIGSLEFLSRHGLAIPNPTAIVLLVVVFAAFAGGLRPGLASAGLAWMYFAWHFSLPGTPFRYTEADLRSVVVLAAITPAIVLMMSVLHATGLRTSRRLKESEERYALAARAANDGLWDWDLRSGSVYYSDRWTSMLGCSPDEVGSDPDEWFKRVFPGDLDNVRQAVQDHLEGRTPLFESEHRVRHKDRGYRWMLVRGVAVRDAAGKATRMAGSQTDITQRKLAEETLLHDALHDALTGLPNRTLFLDRLTQRLRFGRRYQDRSYAVLYLDLDRFKLVNDSLGHEAGDELLQESARRIEKSIRPSDTVARLGGDEFAILLDSIEDPTDAAMVAQRIQDNLQAPLTLRDQELVSTASIGISLSQTGNEKAEDIVRDADTAMYRAKGLGGGRHEIFDAAMHARAVSLLKTESELRHAIERQEFVLLFQPVVSLADGVITGFETLIRWNHPQRGTVSPAEFIGIAEESGLIIPLDRWVVDEACRQLKEWRTDFPAAEDLTVSVNISGRHFSQPDLVEVIASALKRHGLEGKRLAVEITEGVLIKNTLTAEEALTKLRAMGVKIYLDDFGTGYCSLSYLHHFPIDVVKIDRSFVLRMGPEGEGQAIVRAIAVLAHQLGMRIIAEGVETETQRAGLRILSCESGQGYLFSRPLPVAEARSLIQQGASLLKRPVAQPITAA